MPFIVSFIFSYVRYLAIKRYISWCKTSSRLVFATDYTIVMEEIELDH